MIELDKCANCISYFAEGEKVVYCQLCNSIYHHECWENNQGCITSGCQGQPVTGFAEVQQKKEIEENQVTAESDGNENEIEGVFQEESNVTNGKSFAGEFIEPDEKKTDIKPEKRYKEPVLACLLNLLLLGAGYMYLGQVGKGFLWLFIGFVTALITLGIGGFVVLAWVMYDSYQLADKMNKGEL